MGLLDKLFNKIPEDDGILTDDEKELREYEENVYMAESGVTDASYAEFVIDDTFYITGRGAVVTGTVTGGVFNVGDSIQVCRGDNTVLETAIVGIEQFRKVCDRVAEGMQAGLLLKDVDSKTMKSIRRNDIIKKV